MRVGFLFNHYATHQVPHAAPYAFELSRRHPGIEVIIASSSAAEEGMVKKIGELYPGHHCRLVRLRPVWWYDFLDPLLSKFTFGRKNRILRDNLDFFAGLDALVAPERHCRRLKIFYGLKDLPIIHTRHGAGDREGTTDDQLLLFDFVLLPGQKYVDRMSGLGYLRPGRYAPAGWPKFEVVRGLNPKRRKFFPNDNPVVVYNPHFDQHVASWSKMGTAVLDFFIDHPEYNLIFAPHVVLFKRRWRHHGKLPPRYWDISNIYIDTRSPALSDMTYMLAADIYLGDVSSQVYEFLLEPRPCVFLNAHHVDWENDPFYAHWHFGPVVNDVEQELGPALEYAGKHEDEFLPVQQEAFAYTFFNEAGRTAAQRGADIIARFLLGGPLPEEGAPGS